MRGRMRLVYRDHNGRLITLRCYILAAHPSETVGCRYDTVAFDGFNVAEILLVIRSGV